MKLRTQILKLTAPSVAALALVVAPQAVAELTSRGLQGGSSLNGAKLEPARLRPAKLKPSRLQPAKIPQKRPAFKKLSLELVRGGLAVDKLKGAATSIPESRMGELFFDVAGTLEQLEEGVTATAVGYYMASLTDKKNPRYEDAKRRICEIILEAELSQEEAAGLYDGGLVTFSELYQLKVGITPEGWANSMRELDAIKAVYQQKLALESPKPKSEEE